MIDVLIVSLGFLCKLLGVFLSQGLHIDLPQVDELAAAVKNAFVPVTAGWPGPAKPPSSRLMRRYCGSGVSLKAG